MKAVKNYLRSVGRQAIAQAKNTLRTKGIEGSELEDSVSYKLKTTERIWTIEFSMSYYGKFMNDGVGGNNNEAKYYIDENGKKRKTTFKYTDKAPPVKVFEKWIARKGIQGRDKKTGRFITRKSLAFMMARSRQVKGYSGLSFFTKPLSIILKKFPKDLLKNIEKDFYTSIKELDKLKKIN